MSHLTNLLENEWLYKDELEPIIGLVFKVRNEMGAGRSEEIYHQALVSALTKGEFAYVSKPRQTLYHRESAIHTFEPDLIVLDKVILELKVLKDYRSRNFPTYNQQQLLRYLKFNQFSLGLLINFAHSKVGICRMIYQGGSIGFDEDYSRMLPYVNAKEKTLLREVLKLIKQIGRQYGYGYSDEVYQKLIAIELTHHGIECICDLHIPATFQGELVGSQATAFMLIENKFLLNVRGLIEGFTPHDFLTTRTFLRELNLKVGWLVNFGRDNITIRATATKD